MTPIQQQIAALARWHVEQAGSMIGGVFHEESAALLDKLAKADVVPVMSQDGTVAKALLIPEE